MVVFRDEEDEGEMSGTGIPWSVLGGAMGTNEQLGGVQEWLERWMKKSGNQNLKILIIRKIYQEDDISYEDDEDEESILNSVTFAE